MILNVLPVQIKVTLAKIPLLLCDVVANTQPESQQNNFITALLIIVAQKPDR